ncbi:sulfatase-like hydrolase/transferase [Flavobacteriaceae bacterium]|nr:sulfatase-like hydrolase/transferase [Flavobacteriaceae bacterium]
MNFKTTTYSFLLFFAFLVNNINAQKQPNIVFIEVDDLTAKYVGAFGANSKIARTPNVDKLANNGIVFDNAVVQGTMCGPSRNSLISGLYPHNLGFYQNGELRALPYNTWALPKALQEQGYHTEWIGKCHVKPNRKGAIGKTKVEQMNYAMRTQMGFDYVWESVGRVVALKMGKKTLQQGKPWKYGQDAYGDYLYDNGLLKKFVDEGIAKKNTTLDGDTEYMDGFFSTKAINRMASYKGDKPFFMWLNYSSPHGPFDVPQKWHDMFNPADMPGIIELNEDHFEVPEGFVLEHNVNKKYNTVSKIQKYRAQYAAIIAYMDDQVGRIVSHIRSNPKLENTIIVFFSDHGLMTGDHGLLHKTNLYKEVLNPTLIVNYPNVFKPERVKQPVELLDLCKTTIELAGANEAQINAVPNGYSFAPLLTKQGTFKREGVVFSEIEGFRSAFDGTHKYIQVDNSNAILFDHSKNIDETLDYEGTQDKTSKDLKEQVDAWIVQSGEIKAAGALKVKKSGKKKNKKSKEKKNKH